MIITPQKILYFPSERALLSPAENINTATPQKNKSNAALNARVIPSPAISAMMHSISRRSPPEHCIWSDYTPYIVPGAMLLTVARIAVDSAYEPRISIAPIMV